MCICDTIAQDGQSSTHLKPMEPGCVKNPPFIANMICCFQVNLPMVKSCHWQCWPSGLRQRRAPWGRSGLFAFSMSFTSAISTWQTSRSRNDAPAIPKRLVFNKGTTSFEATNHSFGQFQIESRVVGITDHYADRPQNLAQNLT